MPVLPKTFVIDTNVFIHKPDAVLSFRDSEIVIPLWVLEELDKLKTYSDERGRNARHAIRFLDGIVSSGVVSEGVKLENNSVLRITNMQPGKIPQELDMEKPDNRILLTAIALQQEGRAVFFVSKDINARVKAAALGLKAVDYEKQKVNIQDLYSGLRRANISWDSLDELRRSGAIPWKDGLHPNEFVELDVAGASEPILAKYAVESAELVLLDEEMPSISGIQPLNIHQRAAFELLLDDSISLVTMVGKAGTGKTLLAIASGLKKVLEDKAYSRVLVTRPVVPFGKDIGYLPGGKEEKLAHWMQPLFDNLELILSVYKRDKVKSVDSLLTNNLIEIEALTYIRGRSLPSQYIIIDEAQNLSPHEIKTIVSRAGEGTKVVLTGDPYQIDSPYLDSNSNGLSYLVEIFKSQLLYGHITLEKSERSLLAELAAELL
ncbi:MAG: phosphate starvation-inducible protein PhoH [Spirochaetales bacterium]|nr:phosphate starvation-inducible protein PhoH [Spirochaetales bacterium]